MADYVRMMQADGNEREHDAHIRLTTLAKSIQSQLGLGWSEAISAADMHIYGPWRRPGDNGGPLLD
jgi:hypothetical protein